MPKSTVRLFQVSTTAALVQGILKGAISSSLLIEEGDFGLGTFEHLDGEMVTLEGEIFQMCGDGSINRLSEDHELPFAQICRFVSPQTCSLRKIESLKNLEYACDLCRPSENHFYALRINASFKTMHARTVRPTADGVSLQTAGDNEVKFTWGDVKGSLVGFWSPNFSSSFSVPGYHFHFISDDREKGGHVLDCSFDTAASHVQALTDFEVVLPTSGPFLTADLSVDTRSVLRRVE